jgi:hypothetical protein
VVRHHPEPMLDRLQDLSELLNELLLSLSYADRIANAGDVGALAVGLDRVLSRVDPHRVRLTRDLLGDHIGALHHRVRAAVEATSVTERGRRLEALRSQINAGSIVKDFDSMLRETGIGDEPSLIDQSRDLAGIELGEAVDRRLRDLRTTAHQVWKLDEEAQFKVNQVIEELNRDSAALLLELRRDVEKINIENKALSATLGDLITGEEVRRISKAHVELEEREHKDAATWRWISVGIASIGVGLIILDAFTAKAGDVELFMRHLAVLVPLGTIATYCGHQSANHRRRARHWEDQRLDIDTALEWVAKLKKASRDEFLKSHYPIAAQLVDPADMAAAAISPLDPTIVSRVYRGQTSPRIPVPNSKAGGDTATAGGVGRE